MRRAARRVGVRISVRVGRCVKRTQRTRISAARLICRKVRARIAKWPVIGRNSSI
jgi:hypothetical protein